MTAPPLNPGGSTPFGLLWLGEALKEFLERSFADFRLPAANPDNSGFVKQSCRVATTANHVLSGLSAFNGVTPLAGDRVLVKAQTNPAENGPYIAASGAWSRAGDADSSDEVLSGMLVWVSEGTADGEAWWRLTTTDPIVLGTTPLTFAEVSEDADYPSAQLFDRVTVYLGSIKGRERDASGAEVAAQFPLIVVKPRECLDDEGDGQSRASSVAVDLVIGVRRIGNEGFQDVAAIVERIRRALLIAPLVENRARLELPMRSAIGEDESFPQWYGLVETTFAVPQPVEEGTFMEITA